MFSKKIEVRGREISEDAPVFVIAEAACNHMCDPEMARKLIDGAAEAGADAVKFQTYKAERLVRREAESYWKTGDGAISQFDYYKKLDRFDRDEYQALFDYANERGLIAFSTPFDPASASMLDELGMPMFKIASCDLPDTRLLRHIGALEKPVILSTGGSEPDEIEHAIETLGSAGCSELVVLVCTLSYPTQNREAHLRRITTFRKRFPEVIIGLSDHTEPDAQMVIPTCAVALGARVVEKHYTLDRLMTGSGHSFSVTPDDLAKMVENIRLCEEVLGSDEIRVYDSEEAARERARRSLVADRTIKPGERIASNMVGVKRPGTGLPPTRIDEVVGRIARVEIAADQPFRLDDLDEPEPLEATAS